MIPDLETRTITIENQWRGDPTGYREEFLIEQEEFLRKIPYLEKSPSTATTALREIELGLSLGVYHETLIAVNNALTQVPSYRQNVDERER